MMWKLERYLLVLYITSSLVDAKRRLKVVYNNVQPFIYIDKSQSLAYGNEYVMMNYIAQALHYELE